MQTVVADTFFVLIVLMGLTWKRTRFNQTMKGRLANGKYIETHWARPLRCMPQGVFAVEQELFGGIE
jgi:hypothetical protein